MVMPRCDAVPDYTIELPSKFAELKTTRCCVFAVVASPAVVFVPIVYSTANNCCYSMRSSRLCARLGSLRVSAHRINVAEVGRERERAESKKQK